MPTPTPAPTPAFVCSLQCILYQWLFQPSLQPLPRPAGEVAFDAVRALSTCMPGRLGSAAITLTCCLRLVAAAQRGAGLTYRDVASRPATASVVHALAAVTAAAGQQLPSSSYCYVFPVLQVGRGLVG